LILKKNIKNIHKESFYFFEKKIRSIKVYPINKTDKYNNYFSFMYFKYLKRLKNFYYTRNQSREEYDFYAKKFSKLSLDEFNFYVKKYASVLNYNYNKFTTKEIYPGCFCVEKNSKLTRYKD